MEKMETIADVTAELFIRKHFMFIDHTDRLVKVMRKSIRESVKEALVAYESQREQN